MHAQAKLVGQIGSLSSNLKAVAELTASREQHPEQPLFQTLPAPQFGMTAFVDIYIVYERSWMVSTYKLAPVLMLY